MSRGLFALLPALLAALPAAATTMTPLDDAALVQRASVVAVVEVTSLQVKRSGGQLTTVAHLTISREIKGKHVGEEVLAFVPGGAEGEWVQRVEGAPELREGESAVVFLEAAGGGFYRFLGLEQGHLGIRADARAP